MARPRESGGVGHPERPGCRSLGIEGTHLLLDALQALAQLLPLPGEVLVAAPDLLNLLQDVVDTPAREGGRRHQSEVEEKVERPAEPARAGRRGRSGGRGGGGPAAAVAALAVRLVLRMLLRVLVRRGRRRLLLLLLLLRRRRRLLRHVIRAARRVGALLRGVGGAVAALGAPLFGRGHGGGGEGSGGGGGSGAAD